MLSYLLTRLGAPDAAAPNSWPRRAAAAPLRFRRALPNLEARAAPSVPLPAPQLGPARTATPLSQLGALAPLQINNVVVQAGQLVANGALGGTPFQAPLG